jgi:hypothetical protein
VARRVRSLARARAGRPRAPARSRSKSSTRPAPATATRARTVLVAGQRQGQPAGRDRRLPRGRRRLRARGEACLGDLLEARRRREAGTRGGGLPARSRGGGRALRVPRHCRDGSTAPAVDSRAR